MIYAPDTFSAGIISLGYNNLKTTTADVEIEVTDNTLYNITSPNVVARAWQAKSLVVNNNVAYNQVNLETGYIPVNTSVVTNGAGADYDTKYWIAR